MFVKGATDPTNIRHLFLDTKSLVVVRIRSSVVQFWVVDIKPLTEKI